MAKPNKNGPASPQSSPSWSPASDKPGTTAAQAAPPQAPANLPVRELKPDREAVAKRAFEIYCDRCRTNTPGSEMTDWMMAETELARR